MKYVNSLLVLIVLSGVLCFTACSSEDVGDDPTPIDQQLILLENGSKSWVLAGGSVIKDDFDVTDQFNGFELTVQGFNFTTVNSLSGVWADQGSWTFVDDQITKMERNDGVVVNIQQVSSSQLTLRFSDPNGTGGRYSSIPGDYVFTLLSE
jgi:hypothetical protein